MAASLRQAAPVLEVRDLRKSFTIHALGRHVEDLAGVDLVVRAGEHVALVGPSGAGKSTLLKCVWRSCRPTSGAVWLRRADGTVVDLAVAEDRQVAELRGEELGYVSQLLRSEQRPSVVDVVRRAAIRRGVEANEASRVAEAALQVAVQAREEAREGFKAASREAGTLNDKALDAIKALGDGLAMHREAVERHAEDREQALMDAHIAPLEATAANHEERIVPLEATRIDHEERITAVEQRP
jgi:ABC-type glutathione transport system ATPase component